MSFNILFIDWLAALIKIFFQIISAIIIAIPFSISWNCIAPKYLTFIPTLYQHFPYWHFVAIILVFVYIGNLIQKLVPTIINVNNKE